MIAGTLCTHCQLNFMALGGASEPDPPQLAVFPAWLILTIRNNRIFEIALSIQI